MRFLAKNKTGAHREINMPNLTNLSDEDMVRVTKFISEGCIARRDVPISLKAYTPKDSEWELLTLVYGKTQEELNAKYDIINIVASSTRIDEYGDKFSEAVIRALGMDYAKGWDQGMPEGTNLCIMHDRMKMIGKTFAYSIEDMKDKDGNLIKDENGAVAKQLSVRCTVSKAYLMPSGEPVIDYILDGRLGKASISAYIWNWEYITSDRSNWIPAGYTSPTGYFYYPDGSAVEAVELSVVDLGANRDAHVSSKSLYNVEVFDNDGKLIKSYNYASEVAAEPKSTVPTPPQDANSESNNTEKMAKDTTTNTQTPPVAQPIPVVEAEKQSTPVVDTNEGDGDEEDEQEELTAEQHEKAVALFKSLPVHLKKAATVVWVSLSLENYSDKSEFYAPDYCATKFKNMDKKLGNQKAEIAELKLQVSELQAQVSATSDKSIATELSFEDTKKELAKAIAEKEALDKEYKSAQKQFNEFHAELTETYASLCAQLDGKIGNTEMIEAYKVHAKTLSLKDLRDKNANMSIRLSAKFAQERELEKVRLEAAKEPVKEIYF